MSDEIKNFREAIAKFDILKLEMEDLKDSLEKNFSNYKNVSDISNEIANKNQSVLENINTLQINAVSNVEKADSFSEKIDEKNKALYEDIKNHNQSLYDAINKQLIGLKTDTKSIMTEAMNDVSIDTIELSKIIDEKIQSIDTEKIDKFTSSVNKYFENHKRDTQKTSSTIKTITSEIADNKTKLEQELKEYYTEQENWINKLKEQTKRYEKSYKTSRTFIFMMLVSIMIGLAMGTIITKYLTDKQVIIYKELDIPKLEKLSGQENWISSKILKEEMKNKETDFNIFTFIPWWMMILFSFILFAIFTPKEENENENQWD